jgi:phosphopantetheine adenylyltransferase
MRIPPPNSAEHPPRQVYAVIGVNETKTYAVSGKDRKELLERMLVESGLSDKVEVVTCTEYIWQFGKRVGAKVNPQALCNHRTDYVRL